MISRFLWTFRFYCYSMIKQKCFSMTRRKTGTIRRKMEVFRKIADTLTKFCGKPKVYLLRPAIFVQRYEVVETMHV